MRYPEVKGEVVEFIEASAQTEGSVCEYPLH
jgi:hypothetical protein